ncbi:nucleotidyltransferase family protein [candidate division KSB1 bacterium]|nr:MAG: nucleotidyltransferase family protein [candidate division KSB1 bacterium]
MNGASAPSLTSIILAAGRGLRMGMPKLACETDGQSFLERILTTLNRADCRPVTVVIAEEAREYALPFAAKISMAVNPAPERGMLSSIRIGMTSTAVADGYLLFPVDHPFVKPETVRALVSEFALHPQAVIKPVYQERGGHPLIVPRVLQDYLLAHAQMESLRTAIHESGVQQIFLPINDEAVLRNINTPEDLRFP